MPSERVQRQIERLLDEAERAVAARDWALVREHARDALSLDPENADAHAFLAAAERRLAAPSPAGAGEGSTDQPTLLGAPLSRAAGEGPGEGAVTFAAGRYRVQRLLGEGGKKRVYLAHDTLLDRDVAVALLKTEGLDTAGRERVRREAQAMGRLGDHPHIVPVYDLGEERGQPYIVSQFMAGGDLERLIAAAPERRLPLGQTLAIAQAVCRALAFAHERSIVHRDLKPGNVWLTGRPLPPTLIPYEGRGEYVRPRVRCSPLSS